MKTKQKNKPLVEQLTTDEYLDLDVKDINLSQSVMRIFIEDEAFAELMESIKTLGLMNAITVHKKQSTYYLIAGQRRLMAHIRLGKPTIKARVMEGNLETILKMQYTENVHREDVDILSEAKFIQITKDKLGFTNEQLGKMLIKSESYITKRIRFLQIDKDIIQAVLNKTISFNAGILISKAKDKNVVNYLLSFLKDNKMRDIELTKFVDELIEQNEKIYDDTPTRDYNKQNNLVEYKEPMGLCDVCGQLHPLVSIQMLHICTLCAQAETIE